MEKLRQEGAEQGLEHKSRLQILRENFPNLQAPSSVYVPCSSDAGSARDGIPASDSAHLAHCPLSTTLCVSGSCVSICLCPLLFLSPFLPSPPAVTRLMGGSQKCWVSMIPGALGTEQSRRGGGIVRVAPVPPLWMAFIMVNGLHCVPLSNPTHTLGVGVGVGG